MYKFMNDSGSVLLVQRANEARDVAAFLERQPRVLPQAPTKMKQRTTTVVALGFRLVMLLVLALVIAITFFLFGEERPDSVVRPLLTAQQRAQAFRL